MGELYLYCHHRDWVLSGAILRVMAELRVQCIDGQREGSTLLYAGDGFYYTHYRLTKGGEKTLTCYKRNCKGRARCALDGTGYDITVQHSCPVNLNYVDAIIFKRQVRERCAGEPRFLVHRLVADALARSTEAIRMEVDEAALRRKIYSELSDSHPPIPKSLLEMDQLLQEERFSHLRYSIADQNELIYHGVVGEEGSQSAVFAFKKVLDWVTSLHVTFIDGTFKLTSLQPKCGQILCIMTNQEDHIVPLAYVLMEKQNPSEEDYIPVFLKLRDLGLRPTDLVTDFEVPLRKACERVFDCEASGCYWHFETALYRHVGALGLRTEAATDMKVMKVIRLLATVPRAPPHHIVNAYLVAKNLAKEDAEVYAKVHKLLKYFHLQWLVKTPAEVLSVFNVYHTTNNTCEVNNRQMNDMSAVPHPCLWDLFGIIRHMEVFALTRIGKMDAGLRVGVRDRDWRVVNNYIHIRREEEKFTAGDHTLPEFLNTLLHATENVHLNYFGAPLE